MGFAPLSPYLSQGFGGAGCVIRPDPACQLPGQWRVSTDKRLRAAHIAELLLAD